MEGKKGGDTLCHVPEKNRRQMGLCRMFFPDTRQRKRGKFPPARETLGGKKWRVRESGVDVALIFCCVSVRGYTAKPFCHNNFVNCGSKGHVARLFALFLLFAVCFSEFCRVHNLCRVFF
jgi:hypothetical protein